MINIKGLAKVIFKSKAFWSAVAGVALVVATPAGAVVVKLVETIVCVAMGGCV